jgi:ribonuclease P protein component
VTFPDTPLRLRKAQRIQRQSDFLRLKEAGRRIASGCVLVNWGASRSQAGNPSAPPRDLDQVRLGVITSRRIGSAVVRNRSRRLVREVFRKHQHSLRPGTDIIVIARPSIVGRSYRQVESDLTHAFRKARLTMDPEPGTSGAGHPPGRP